MGDTVRIPVRVRGSVRGTPIEAEGSVRLYDNIVSVQVGEREHAVRVERVDGVVWEPPDLTIHVARDAIIMSGHAGLEPLGTRIIAAALTLPELTRTMHSLGSRRGHPGADHDRFFGALLNARRLAEGFVEPESRLKAFEPRRLSAGISTLLGELAAERYPESAPDRRALEAELLEYAERLFATLASLDEAAARVRESGDDVRLARWRDWTLSVQRVFEEADRCWVAALPSLTAAVPRPRRRRFWRRANGAAIAATTLGHATAAIARFVS